ncbi:hypothetical protein L9F63_016393 [Diploptera punctata]|uniref:HCLS1-associated protein X-1 n=1 Tax=Diploptera punctata TaxID=6984 RepID=A0AAD8A363_DIPPU|nr:hypothetical protein L9F63_016393 [Diploptera punctata]
MVDNFRDDVFRNLPWNIDDEEDEEEDSRTRSPNSPYGFRVFSDPLEIHKFFEHQMEEFMRNFSMLDIPGRFDDQMMPPMIEEAPQNKRESLRDQYLKPGFESAVPDWYKEKSRQDTDLDERVVRGELDKILGCKPSLESDDSNSSLVPAIPKTPNMQIKVFGQSVTSKTIRKPDGSVEIHRTVIDNKGNEEKTVTRQRGDQSYTVTIRKDSSGTEECSENLHNLQEQDLDDFKKKWFEQDQPKRDLAQKTQTLFDKFFKL